MKIATISYPRSGASFLQLLLKTVKFKKVDRFHNFNAPNNFNKYDVLILLLRDYKECTIRQCCDSFPNIDYTYEAKAYFDNLNKFEKTTNKKYTIYYEDFIIETDEVLKKLGSFLSVDFSNIIDNLDYYINLGRKNYNKKKDDCTHTDSKTIHFHKHKINIEKQKELDSIFQNYNPPLFDKYLKRYLYDQTV